MKKTLFALTLVAISFGTPSVAQTDDKNETQKVDTTQAQLDSVENKTTTKKASVEIVEDEVASKETISFHQIIKDRFIEGGVEFMSIVLICLILGLAVAIERIITLNLASTNTEKLLADVKAALLNGGVEKARALCATIPGPVASIFAQGLLRAKEGPEAVEKSILQYGSVEMGKLEKGLSWVSLFIALAPMFGFMGTVIGMIGAFDKIAIADDISASIVADGIKVALLTTVAGLIVAVILQIAYNYCIHKIDAIVNDMEEASISFVDTLIAHDIIKNK